MSGIPSQLPLPPSEPQGEVQAAERDQAAPVVPASGSVSSGENPPPKKAPAPASSPQDEVKVQWDNSDRVEIYQFVNQQGSLIMQVPSDQLLNLARQIAVELAKNAASRQTTPAEGAEGEETK